MADEPVELKEIAIEDLTSGHLEGTGHFDRIISRIKLSVNEEFAANRIKGTDYANVYLGSIQAALSEAVQFTLNKDQAYWQALLIKQQGELIELEKLKLVQETRLISAQVDKINTEILAINQNISLSKEQELNVIAERGVIEANEERVKQETDNLVTAKSNMIKEGVRIDADTQRTVKETILIDENIKTAPVQRQQIERTTYKVNAEINLLQSKKNTEDAQTIGGNVSTDSVVGRQKELYKAQTEGFARDAEQRIAKLMVDSYAVTKSAQNGSVPPSSLGNESIDEVIAVAKKGINA